MKKKVIIAVVVLLVVGGGYWLLGQVTRPLPGKDVPDQGRKHVDESVWSTFKYNSNPPTSGPHDPVWTTKGIYSSPIGKGHVLHSLEHGYIEMHYNCAAPKTNVSMDDGAWSSQSCKNLVDDLKQIVNEKTLWKMIDIPNQTIDTKLTIAAWDRIDPMTPAGSNGHISGSQKAEIEDFIDTFRDHGPEQTMEP